MKIDMTQQIRDFQNRPILVRGSDEPITLRDVCVAALNGAIRGDEMAEYKQTIRRGMLAKMLIEKDHVALDTDTITLLKERIGRYHINEAIMATVAIGLLDPNATLEEDQDEEEPQEPKSKAEESNGRARRRAPITSEV